MVQGIPSGFATEATGKLPPKNPNEESEMSEAEEEGEEESDAWGYSYGTFQPRNIHKP